jgi:hypothetical protein
MDALDPRHGTTRGYHAGCHDACCRRAMARYEKAGRLARLNGGRAVPAIGAQRRIQALMALGWSSQAIATAAGQPHRNYVLRILNGQKGKPTLWVERKTHAWVSAVYEELSMRLPDGPYADRTRQYAAAQGYAPPLAYDCIDDPNERPKGSANVLETDGRYRGPADRHNQDVIERIWAGEWHLESSQAERATIVDRWLSEGRSRYSLHKLTGWRIERYEKEAA